MTGKHFYYSTTPDRVARFGAIPAANGKGWLPCLTLNFRPRILEEQTFPTPEAARDRARAIHQEGIDAANERIGLPVDSPEN